MNPTDAFRKAARRKELAKNKKQRTAIREVALTYKDPDEIRENINRYVYLAPGASCLCDTWTSIHRIKRSTDGNLDNQQLKQVQEVRAASLKPLLARIYIAKVTPTLPLPA